MRCYENLSPKISKLFLILWLSFSGIVLAKEYTNTSFYVAYDSADSTQFALVLPSVNKVYTHKAGQIAATDLKQIDTQFVSSPTYNNGELCFSALIAGASGDNGASVMANKCYTVNFFYTQKEEVPNVVTAFILTYRVTNKVYEGIAGDAASFKVVRDGNTTYNAESISNEDYSDFSFDVSQAKVIVEVENNASVLDKLSFYCWDGIVNYNKSIEQTEDYNSPLIYLNPIDKGENRFTINAEVLHRKGAKVWYLMSGNPPLAYIDKQIEILTSYNSTHEKRIIGMQMDIEPWALFADQNNSENKAVWQEYLDLLQHSAKLLHEKNLKLSVSIPFWLDKISQAYPNNRPLNQEVIDIADEVIVMDYTVYPERIYLYAKSTFEYADSKGKKVKIALELSDINDDNVSFYSHPEGIREIIKTPIEHISFDGYVIHALKDFVVSNLYLSRAKNRVKEMHYVEHNSTTLLNPDRGFYDADYVLNETHNDNIFSNAYADGYTLVYAPLSLEAYKSSKILPDSLLETIRKNLNDANSSGVRLIFRLKYRNSLDGDDPSRETIVGHLEQLTPVLQTYKDVISVVQAGTIGAWGEWHSFTGDYAESNTSYKSNRREIVKAWANIFPDKYIQIRTPMHKEELFGGSASYGEINNTAQITTKIAYSDDIRAKIGQHNDCFLADASDMGTYSDNNISFWKAYVAHDSRYAPVGGETCGIGDGDDALLSDCDHAINALKEMQYSFINDAYHPDVLQKWKDGGCYEEIKENLGYRLVIKSLDMLQSDKKLSFSLAIENKGYAAPYIKSDISFILQSDSEIYRLPLTLDTRTLYPNKTVRIGSSVSVTNIEKGSYCLSIEIGKDNMSIKLGNKDIWDVTHKSNNLICGIEIK